MIICDRCVKDNKIVPAKWTVYVLKKNKVYDDYCVNLCDRCIVEVKRLIRGKTIAEKKSFRK